MHLSGDLGAEGDPAIVGELPAILILHRSVHGEVRAESSRTWWLHTSQGAGSAHGHSRFSVKIAFRVS